MTQAGGFQGRATDQGRIFQAAGDQHIQEHHHHYAAQDDPFGRLPVSSRQSAQSSAAPHSVRVPLVGRPPGVLRDRTELMDLLRSAVAGPGHDIHVVHGMGGNGKTAVAYTLFMHAVREYRRAAFWVNASEYVSLRAGMLAVAGDRGAGPGQLAAAAAGQYASADLTWRYLDQSDEPWLLVLDNADDPDILEQGGWLRASARGTVVVTTRHATASLWTGPGISRHHLDVLPLDDAAQVLCDLAPEAGGKQAARKVAERLGCLPLALTLAGSHLAHQLLESWSMDDYARKLTEESTTLIDRGARNSGSTSSRQLVGRTWQLSLDALTAQGLPEAATLLRLLSFWAADPVPLTLLMPLARGQVVLAGVEPPLAAEGLEPALRGLLDHSLAEMIQVADLRCVRAHGVLLDSIAAGMPDSARAALAEGATALLRAALPDEDTPQSESREVLAILAPHAVSLLQSAPSETTAGLLAHLLRQLHEAGDWAGSLAMSEAAAERAGGLLGAEHPVVLDVLDVMARGLFRTAKYAESESLHRRVLASRERVLGPDHPDSLRSCFGLHQPLDLLDRDEESEYYIRRTVAGQRLVLGEDSAETLLSRTFLLEMLAQLGKEDEYDVEAPAVVADCERLLPPDHLTTLYARHLHSAGLEVLGRHAEAEPLARRAWADRARVQGVDHPMTLSAHYNVIRIVHALGKTDEAISLMRQLIEVRERVLGSDHPFNVGHREELASWLGAEES
ncbi:tetratricopeptide repeat protein [Streptomyces erythrochromogenes]|uniref:tetratricopeptide repeat protein n=1 Tax=Streptomyces erythrochromogenes TaxID=285574 RepID=UPI0033E4FD20